MLFNSYQFIFLFLPIVLTIYLVLRRLGKNSAAVIWTVAASLFFYAWWDYRFLVFLCGSIILNYLVGRYLQLSGAIPTSANNTRFYALACGVLVNLSLIGYFKYAGFLAGIINSGFGTHIQLGQIVLPLAISFFTFQQIAFLVDSYRREVNEYDFSKYCLFVTFFPQLIAGPIVHHKEMMPQFDRLSDGQTKWALSVAIGLTIFAIGLFKKVVIADGISVFANPVFSSAAAGDSIDFFTAWSGALAYSVQLYFDFSGYSDMAIGLARMFGVILPLNFNAPYRSLNIIEFWRRWHMTLSRFLRDYVYFQLGGNRKGPSRRYVNLLMTMLIGGLWHGAGWTFVIWGGLHGVYLIVNHGWHRVRRMTPMLNGSFGSLGRTGSLFTTLLAVVVAWVLFRAESFSSALLILKGMSGLSGVALPSSLVSALGNTFGLLLDGLGIESAQGGGRRFVEAWTWIILTAVAALTFPTTHRIMHAYQPALDYNKDDVEEGRHAIGSCDMWFSGFSISWSPTLKGALIAACILTISFLSLSNVSEFLYFQF